MLESRHVPYSVRRGVREPFGFHEGIPEHIEAELYDWAEAGVRPHGSTLDVERVNHVVSSLQLPITHSHPFDRWEHVKTAMGSYPDIFLDVLDVLLPWADSAELEWILHRGMSRHTVAASGASGGWQLEERVTPEARKTYEAAVSVRDEIAADLSEAWQRAFGLHPDASDAWFHATRAVEGALHDIVLPKANRGQFGPIVQAIKDAPQKWQFLISAGDEAGDGSAIVPTLELIGYEPGRHPGEGPRASLEQAKAVVVQAATVVEWVRQGAFFRVDDR